MENLLIKLETTDSMNVTMEMEIIKKIESEMIKTIESEIIKKRTIESKTEMAKKNTVDKDKTKMDIMEDTMEDMT